MKIMPRLRCLSAPTRIVYNIRKNKKFADQESEMEGSAKNSMETAQNNEVM